MKFDDIQGEALCCPKCGSAEQFHIAATVWVTVDACDSLTVIDDDGDREYGSEDACRCSQCGHQARLGDFEVDEEEDEEDDPLI